MLRAERPLGSGRAPGPKDWSLGTYHEGGRCRVLHQPIPAVAEYGGAQEHQHRYTLVGSLTCLPVLPPALRGV